MKSLLLVFLVNIMYPLQQVENIKLFLPSQQHEIFIDYANDNFSQHVFRKSNSITIDIKSSDFFNMDLNFRVLPNSYYLKDFSPEVREAMSNLIESSLSLEVYIRNVSSFLEHNIRYSIEDYPQDTASVLYYRKANCVGFSNVMKFFLDAAGIDNRQVRGFYLEKGKNSLIPVPHRWIEIRLANGRKFFYDPQFQKFSPDYIATRGDVDFKQVKKFYVRVIEKSKKITN